MFKLFNKKNQCSGLLSPIKGQVVDLGEVPDPVFSQKLLGDGVAIKPTEGVVYAPIDGEVVQFFETRHAIAIKTENDIEILIHVGIDTVELKGAGFTGFIKTGDKVTKGQKMLEFDLELVKKQAKSDVTPIVITNSAQQNYTIEKNYGMATDNQYVIMQIK